MCVFNIVDDVPIRDEYIPPAIVIGIKEACAESDEQVTLFTEMRFINDIRERPVPVVPVKRVGFIREVRNENIEPSVAVVIVSGNPHPRLRNPVETVSAASQQRNFTERSIPVVIKKIVSGIVVCDIKIWNTIVIEVG